MAMYALLIPASSFGKFISSLSRCARSLAESLSVSPSTLNRIINGQSGICPEMALRLSKALGRTRRVDRNSRSIEHHHYALVHLSLT